MKAVYGEKAEKSGKRFQAIERKIEDRELEKGKTNRKRNRYGYKKRKTKEERKKEGERERESKSSGIETTMRGSTGAEVALS